MPAADRPVLYVLHVATLGRYQEILEEALTAIRGSGELGAADRVLIGVVGDGAVAIAGPYDRITIVRNGPDVTLFEFPTLDMIRSAARSDPSLAIVYLNCLGGRYTGADYDLRARWRAMLLYLFVDRRSLCLDLLDRHDIVGVEWTMLPMPHMTSNNWMANAAYVAGLPPPADFGERVAGTDLSRFGPRWTVADIKRRHAGEFWIGADPAARPYSLLPISRMGLPRSEFASAPWWALPGIDWRDQAVRRHKGGRRPGWRFAVQAAKFRLIFLARALKRRLRAAVKTPVADHRV